MALKIKKIKRRPGLVLSGDFSPATPFGQFNQRLAQHYHHRKNYELGLFADTAEPLPLSLSAYASHLPKSLALQIEHRSIPVLIPPDRGHWVITQPWEYGAIPENWFDTLRYEVDDLWVHTPNNYQDYLQAGFDAERLFLIPPGIDTQCFHPQGAGIQLPEAHTDTTCFLFAGEALWYTGLDLILQAFQNEFLADEKVSLVLWCPPGEGTAYQEMLERIEQAKSGTSAPITLIHSTLSPQERAALYRSCDYLVAPSRGEAFGHYFFEAAACGLPLILSDLPGHFGLPDHEAIQWLPGKLLHHSEKQIAGIQTHRAPFWHESNLDELRFVLRHALDADPPETQSLVNLLHEKFPLEASFETIEHRIDEIRKRPLRRQTQHNFQSDLLTALNALENQEWNTALTRFEALRQQQPGDPFILSHMASIYVRQGQYLPALQLLLPLLEQGSDRENSYHLAGVALFHLQAWSLSQAYFEQVLLLNSAHPGALASLPLSQEKAGQAQDQSHAYPDYQRCIVQAQAQFHRPTLSLCMIVKNESLFLRQCLESVQNVVDQIVVVDTGSEDDTVAIAQEMGAEVHHFEWTGDFSEARNQALRHAHSDWILILDADETLAPESLANLEALLSTPQPQLTAYQLKIRNLSEDNNTVDVVEHYMIRLFPNHPDLRFKGAIHEQLVATKPDVEYARLAVPDVLIMHYGYTGQVMDARDKYARNLALIKKTIAEDPKNPFHWFNLGLTYRVHSEDQEALTAFEQAVTLSQDMEELPAYMAACHCYILSLLLQQGRYEDAKNHAHTAPDICRESPDYWVNYGSLWNHLQNPDKAINAFQKALEMRRHEYQAIVSDRAATTWKPLAGMGNTYLFQGDLEQADHYFRRALKENPNQPDILLGLLRLALHRQAIPQAEDYLTQLEHITQKLDNSQQNRLALEKSRLQLLQGASPDQQLTALISGTNDPQIRMQAQAELALLKARQQDFKTAQELLLPLMKHPGFFEQSLRFLYQGGAFEELLTVLEHLIEHKPKPEASDYSNLGVVYLKLERFTDAQRQFERALEHNPDQIEAQHNLGVIALQQGDLPEAKRIFHAVIKKTSEHLNSYLDLGKIAVYEQAWSLAQNYLNQALALEPKHIEALSLKALCAERLEDFDTAGTCYLDILDQDPYHEDSLIQLGLLLNEAEVYGEALKLFERALNLGNTSIPLYNGIGLCFLQTERYTEARNAFLLALRQAPENPDLQRAVQISDELSGQAPLCLIN